MKGDRRHVLGPLRSLISRIGSPVRLSVLFSNRLYHPGESIEAAIQLVTGVRLDIASGHIELLCRPRRGTPLPDVRVAEAGQGGEMVHSQAVFSDRRLIAPGAEEVFAAALRVARRRPPAWIGPNPRWRLRVRFALYGGTDVSSVQDVRVESDWERFAISSRDEADE